MKNIIQKFKDYIPYIAVVMAIVLPWFFHSGYLFFTDFVWGNKFATDWHDGWFFINMIFIGASFVFSVAFIQKVFISLVLLITILGSKKLIEETLLIFKYKQDDRFDHWLVFIVSLFALFNPFVYDRVLYGQFGVVAALGCLLFAVGYLLAYIRNVKNQKIILFSLFGGLMFMFSTNFIFFLASLTILFMLISFIKKDIGWKIILRDLIFVSAVILIINANWLADLALSDSNLSNFVNQGISVQDLSVFQTSGKAGIDALKNVVMMSGFWGKDQYRYFDITKFKENWGRSFLLLLPIIILGAVSIFKKGRGIRVDAKYLQSFAIGLIIVYITAVILAVGIRLPIAREITYWLFDYFPFYKGVRETQKWVAMIVVIYTIFLSIGVKEFFKIKIIETNKLIVSLFLGGVIIMQAPLMLWGFAGQVKPTEYPKDWYETDKFIKSESYKVYPVKSSEAGILQEAELFNRVNKVEDSSAKCQGNILFLPWHAYMSFDWIGHIVANPAKNFFFCPVISGTNMEWGGIYDNSQSEEGNLINQWLVAKGKTDLLINNKFNISYIILAKEIDWKNYLWLEKIPEIKLIKETKTLKVYKFLID